MKQPLIDYEGIDCEVLDIAFYNEKLLSVLFKDENGESHIAHRKLQFGTEGYDKDGFLHLDLEKRLKWGE